METFMPGLFSMSLCEYYAKAQPRPSLFLFAAGVIT